MFTVLEPMQACDAMLNGKPHPVKAAWFMVDNFAQQMSDRNQVIKALKSLDFLVVSDYVMSATADLADVVLPAGHLHGEDRPAVVEQLLPAVHAEHGPAPLGVEVRPRRGEPGRRRRWASASTSPTPPTST